MIGVLHDFDKAGFSILHTLAADTDRYQARAPSNIVDLGLRLADVQQLGLESERVSYDSEKDPRQTLAPVAQAKPNVGFWWGPLRRMDREARRVNVMTSLQCGRAHPGRGEGRVQTGRPLTKPIVASYTSSKRKTPSTWRRSA